MPMRTKNASGASCEVITHESLVAGHGRGHEQAQAAVRQAGRSAGGQGRATAHALLGIHMDPADPSHVCIQALLTSCPSSQSWYTLAAQAEWGRQGVGGCGHRVSVQRRVARAPNRSCAAWLVICIMPCAFATTMAGPPSEPPLAGPTLSMAALRSSDTSSPSMASADQDSMQALRCNTASDQPEDNGHVP